MDEFKVVFLPVFPDDGIYPYCSQTIKTYDAAKTLLDEIARFTLYLHKEKIMHDFSNFGYIERKVDGEWIEIEDE